VAGLAALYRLQAEACAADGKDAAMYADLEAKALADLARWAKMAIDAGVAERMVRIAEGTGSGWPARLRRRWRAWNFHLASVRWSCSGSRRR
jgi:hypothetical protein